MPDAIDPDSVAAARNALHGVRVVLYEPQNHINIATTVRAMKNMGVRDLVLVRPVEYVANRIEQVAHDTRDIVSRIVHVHELDDALADCTMVAAFSGRRRAARWRTSTPRELAPELLARAASSPVALLFGREDHGLPNEALDRSDVLVQVPTTEHASLNLAQAVLLALYELHMATETRMRTMAPPRKAAPPATEEQRERFFHDAQVSLDGIDFFKTRNPELVVRSLRSVILRADADARELDLLRAMALEVRRAMERTRLAALGMDHPRGGLGTGPNEERRWRERAVAVIPGGVSTGSKRAAALYGDSDEAGPTHYRTARGCRLVTAGGTEMVDLTMALGAVALGYADPEVARAISATVQGGNVTGLSSMLEVEVAEALCEVIPCAEQVRFLKSGAEGVAAAVRIARTATGRSRIVGCGYFGWLDWCAEGAGVPAGASTDLSRVPFGDVAALDEAVAAAGNDLAAIVLEPVIERAPDEEWLAAARAHCDRTGAVLIFDEIKTGFRLATGGWQEVGGVVPDIAVFGKALANGYPLAAVVGRRSVMSAAERTWISSTLAAEATGLAAARAVLQRHARTDVCAMLGEIGGRMRRSVEVALGESGVPGVSVEGLDSMWFVRFDDPARERRFLRAGRDAGVLFKRGAYCFASLAHDDGAIAAVTRAARSAFAALQRAAEDIDA